MAHDHGGKQSQFMPATPARESQFIARRAFPLAAPQGEERAATSKTRRRRSDSLGTRSVGCAYLQGSARSRVPKLSLHRPPGARSSRPVPHAPPAPARSGHPVGRHAARNSRLSACTSGAASGAPPNSMALGAPHRRRRCSRPRGCTCTRSADVRPTIKATHRNNATDHRSRIRTSPQRILPLAVHSNGALFKQRALGIRSTYTFPCDHFTQDAMALHGCRRLPWHRSHELPTTRRRTISQRPNWAPIRHIRRDASDRRRTQEGSRPFFGRHRTLSQAARDACGPCLLFFGGSRLH